MKYYKLLVHRMVLNKDKVPLRNEKGEVVRETRIEKKVVHKRLLALDADGREQRVLGEDEPLTRLAPIEEHTAIQVDVIPTRIKDMEFTVYQEVSDDGTVHSNFYDEQGQPFSFESHVHAFESEIVDTEAQPPFLT